MTLTIQDWKPSAEHQCFEIHGTLTKNVCQHQPVPEKPVMLAWITKRPPYCDRGHWQAGSELPGLDAADSFPRYFMSLDRAVAEMTDWLNWRLYKIPYPNRTLEEFVFLRDRQISSLRIEVTDDTASG